MKNRLTGWKFFQASYIRIVVTTWTSMPWYLFLASVFFIGLRGSVDHPIPVLFGVASISLFIMPIGTFAFMQVWRPFCLSIIQRDYDRGRISKSQFLDEVNRLGHTDE